MVNVSSIPLYSFFRNLTEIEELPRLPFFSRDPRQFYVHIV